jgi:hypothetical protein
MGALHDCLTCRKIYCYRCFDDHPVHPALRFKNRRQPQDIIDEESKDQSGIRMAKDHYTEIKDLLR